MYILYRTLPDNPDAFILRDVDSNRAIFVHTNFISSELAALPSRGWEWAPSDVATDAITYTFTTLDDIPELFI